VFVGWDLQERLTFCGKRGRERSLHAPILAVQRTPAQVPYVAALQGQGLGAKYIRNLMATMSAMWEVALAWKYVVHQPLAAVILPACEKPTAGAYSEQEAIAILSAAPEPFKTFLWILGESGMRAGEVCGLDAEYVHLDGRVISVRQSESLGNIVRRRPKQVTGTLPSPHNLLLTCGCS